MPLEKFTSDNFPLSIQTGSGKPFRDIGVDRAAEFEEVGPENPAFNTGMVCSGLRRDGGRFFQRSSGVINASCLSIIGMIEPGRTVRLYRQIH